MTIQLSDELRASIRPLVLSGRFASEEEVVTEAVRVFLLDRDAESHLPGPPPESDHGDGAARKPIWERALERTADIPESDWSRVPEDLSEQHDHYIHGTPKRPAPP